MLIAGCGGSGTRSRAETVRIDLVEQNDSGQSGTATLTAVDGGSTRVLIELPKASGGLPAHIHEQSCERINPRPVNDLFLVLDGRSETVVDVSLEHLRSIPHAINVHRTPDLLDNSVTCGTVGEGAGLPGR